jgi:RNA 3'-terminal phosphate cyclase (ATP)
MMEVSVSPSSLHGSNAWDNDDAETQAIIRLSGLPPAIAVREKKIFVQNDISRIYVRQDEADSIGNAITAWRGSRGSYVLGEKGKRAELVAQEALDALKKEDKDVDLHLADQLLVYAAMAAGRTEYRTSSVSGHLRTNASVISEFIARKIAISDEGIVSVD